MGRRESKLWQVQGGEETETKKRGDGWYWKHNKELEEEAKLSSNEDTEGLDG